MRSDNMKTLIVYYSRTSQTKKIAKIIQKDLNCDIEEITVGEKYNGTVGYIKGGFDASANRVCKINKISKNPKDYDLVIIGTPVWASTMATPIYSYLKEYSNEINEIASFCTCGGSGYEKTLKKIAKIANKTPIATMYLTKKEIKNPKEKINNFENKIKNR